MDLVSILLIALAGALAVFFLMSPKSSAPAPAPAPAPKKKSSKKKKAKSPAPVKKAPEPEVESESEEEAAPAPSPKQSKAAKKKKAKKAAAKARKEAEAAAKKKAEAAAKKAAKKKAKKAAKKAAAAPAAAAEPSAADETVAQSTWEDEDDDAGEWESVSAIRLKKKQSPKAKAESKFGGPTVRKTIDVGRNIPALMGRGGSNIKAIREATGVDISIPRRDENSTVVTVSGNADGVTAALELIRAKIDGGSPGYVDDRDSETITIDENDVRLVIGRGGSTIKLIEAECGASLNVSKEGTPTVVIRGDEDQIDAAKALIEKVIAGRGLLNGVRETLALADGQARVVIGTKGATVNRIKDNTGAQLKITDAQVEIFGTPEQVKAAATQIRNILADYSSFTMEVDGRQCGTIIGSKGATISKLQRDSGASINVDSSTNVVTISGSKSAIAAAKSAITAVLEAPRTFSPLAAGVSSETLELGNTVSRVIGRRGATVRKIEADTGAKLEFIDQTCRISGTDDEVAAAQEAVQKILDEEAKREENRKRLQEERAAAAAAAAEAAAQEDPEDELGDDDLEDAAGW